MVTGIGVKLLVGTVVSGYVVSVDKTKLKNLDIERVFVKTKSYQCRY